MVRSTMFRLVTSQIWIFAMFAAVNASADEPLAILEQRHESLETADRKTKDELRIAIHGARQRLVEAAGTGDLATIRREVRAGLDPSAGANGEIFFRAVCEGQTAVVRLLRPAIREPERLLVQSRAWNCLAKLENKLLAAAVLEVGFPRGWNSRVAAEVLRREAWWLWAPGVSNPVAAAFQRGELELTQLFLTLPRSPEPGSLNS